MDGLTLAHVVVWCCFMCRRGGVLLQSVTPQKPSVVVLFGQMAVNKNDYCYSKSIEYVIKLEGYNAI